MIPRTPSENKEVKSSIKKLNKGMDLTPDGQLIVTSFLGSKIIKLPFELKHSLDEKEIKELTTDITKETESYLTGWTSGGQKSYLKNSIGKLIAENKIKDKKLIEALQHDKTQNLLLEMLYNSKYIFLNKDLKERDIYIEAFNQCLQALAKEPGLENLEAYFAACLMEQNLCRLLPLAVCAIKTHYMHLEDFNLSELLAHRVAYAIAKNPNQITKVIINDKDGQFLYSYRVEDIHIIKSDGQKDRGLIGAILMPDSIDKVNSPTLQILWAGTHSTESAKIDSEICPGEESYRRGEDQVLKQVISKITELHQHSGKPINVVMSGHSLGGALSQLTFHSLQRILIMDLEDNEVHESALQWEIEFQKKLTQETSGVEHQRPLVGLKLSRSVVQSMCVEAWNSPGVLRSVSKHSNQMCSVLVDKGILQNAIFGMVHGDVIQTGGQATVLNEVGKNKANIRMLKVQPNSLNLKTKSMAGMGAFSVGRVIGTATIGGPIGAATAAVTLGGVTYVSLGKLAADAHRMHHFKESKTPQHSYVILTSHCLDGSINNTETGCQAICNELSCKSVVVDAGARALSLFGVTQARTDTLKEKNEAKFKDDLKQAEENKSPHAFMNLATLEIKTQPATAAVRVLKMIEDGKVALNGVDAEGKTLLHHAIEKGCVELSKSLLEKENMDVNLQDNFGNTPLLTFMLCGSISYEVGLALLANPKLDITKKNDKGISARSVHNGWRSYGVPGSQVREFCLKLKEILDKAPVEREKVMRVRVSI